MNTRRLMVVAVAFLAIFGVVAAAGRTAFVADFGERVEPFRKRTYVRLGLRDLPDAERLAIARDMDDQFAARPTVTLLHVALGGAFMLLFPLQLSRRIRARYPLVHRWNGRLLLTAGTVSGVAGLFFGVLMPYAGVVEGVAVALVGGFFLFALGRAFVAIRAGHVSVHREWMLRAIGVALGISVVRFVVGVYDVVFSPLGFAATTLFAASVWTGWAVSISAAEWWIRRTRPTVLGGAAGQPVLGVPSGR